jgi:signal transduction histidine kinase
MLPTVPIARYPSSAHRVVINFTGVSLAVPGRVRYRYRLEGYDNEWSQPTESREAAYARLPPGQYTFRVLASNSQGIWNAAPGSVVLEVTPQMAETGWFRTLAVVFAAAAIIAALRYRLARVHAAVNLRFEERLAERTRIARELHDTLLQSFQGLMLRLQVVDDLLPPGKAKDHLQLSLERADQAITEGRSAVKDLRSSSTCTNDLAQAVKAGGDELAPEGSAAFHLIVEGSVRDLDPIIRDELYRIAREALRNAFKHAAARHIETEIAYGERVLRLRVRDDGQGLRTDLLKVGRPGHYGLSGMRERAHQIGARLEIWSGENAGTEIEISIPAALAYRAAPVRLFGLFPTKALGGK